jgi:hypothetical protein
VRDGELVGAATPVLLHSGAARLPGLLVVHELRVGGGIVRQPGARPAPGVPARPAAGGKADVVGHGRGAAPRRGPAGAADARAGLHPPRRRVAVGRRPPARAAPRHGLLPVQLQGEVVPARHRVIDPRTCALIAVAVQMTYGARDAWFN